MADVYRDGGGYSSYSSDRSQPLEGDRTLIAGRKARNFDSILGVLLLNCSMAGIQFTFAIMSTVLTPYNDFLALTETEKTAITVIGPICGFFVQPIFGSWSDGCGIRFGRRRIFILGGVLFIIMSLCFIGYGYVGENHSVAVGLAVSGMIIMNVSINVMLCPARAIVSDLVSTDAQNKGQIYAALMMGAAYLLCNFIVYGLSFNTAEANYSEYIECFKDKSDLWSKATLTTIICSIGIAFVIISQIPTMIYGKETPLVVTGEKKKEEFIFIRMAKQIRYMPKIIIRVCIVFFGSWAGYYPFQMFCSDIYGLQLGSLATAVGSIVTFVISIFLDKIVRKLGERNVYKISQGIGAVAMICMLFPFLYVKIWREIPTDQSEDGCSGLEPATEAWVQAVVCILVGLVGINNAVMNSVPFGIIGKCGGEAKGLYMGILNCCCVLAQALSIVIDIIWTAIFPSDDCSATGKNDADPSTNDGTVNSLFRKLILTLAYAVKPHDGDDNHTEDPDDCRMNNMLSQLGHVVVCAVFSFVAFGLCFILRNPDEVDAQPKEEREGNNDSNESYDSY